MRDVVVKVPEDSPATGLRGKEVHIEIALKDIKRLDLAEIDEQFLDSLGFKKEEELRNALREQMQERIDFDIKQAMRRQVTEHLLTNTTMELPAKLTSRQADRVIDRRRIDLMIKGIPRERIESNLERIKQGAAEEGAKELKTFFILQKVAEDSEIDVSEAELNGRIAMLAMQQGERPEKLKQQMSKDTTLANLYIQMREEKAVEQGAGRRRDRGSRADGRAAEAGDGADGSGR